MTYNIHYSHYYKKRICNLAWHSLTKRGPKQPTSSERSVSIKRKQIRLSLRAPTCPAPRAGRQPGLRPPDRHGGCRKASRRARTKLIAQVINCFGNSCLIFKAKILMHLAIMHISDISVIHDITDIKVIKRIRRMKS